MKKERKRKKKSVALDLNPVPLGRERNHLASTGKPRKCVILCTSTYASCQNQHAWAGVEYQELLHGNGPIRLLDSVCKCIIM